MLLVDNVAVYHQGRQLRLELNNGVWLVLLGLLGGRLGKGGTVGLVSVANVSHHSDAEVTRVLMSCQTSWPNNMVDLNKEQ